MKSALFSRSLTALFAALPLTLIAACGGGDDVSPTPEEGPSVDCATVTVPKFSAMTVWAECTSCHASTLSGADRGGAPAGIDYDVYASAVEYAELAVEEVYEAKMPYPDGTGSDGNPLSESMKNELYNWALCGTPE